MLNQCQFIGNLGADPDVRRLQSGDPVVNLRLAVSEKWRDKNGERKERTEWVTIVIFNEGLCSIAERYLKKGSKIFVSGKQQTRKWQDQNGQDRYSTEVVLQKYRGELTMLDGRSDDQSTGQGQGGTIHHQAPAGGDIEDDIPF